MKKILSRLWGEVHGQDVAEYALLLLMVSLASIAAVSQFACAVSCLYEEVGMVIDKARDVIPPGQEKQCMKKCT